MLFKHIVGHPLLKSKLIANVRNNRISHAQLFFGPEGCGHLPLALALARYIQCTNKGTDDACGSCPSCQKFNKFEHPDLHFFFPVATTQEHKKDVSSKLFYGPWRELLLKTPYFSYMQWLEKIGLENKQAIINAEDCNDIIRLLGLKAYESPYKIVIVYMVEKLYHAAAPKLLKILEEPPDNTLFILITENKDAILNTILSRAQLVKIPGLGEDVLETTLIHQHHVEAQQARQLAFLTGGNYVEALQLMEEQTEPFDNFYNFRNWMRLCFRPNMQHILAWVEPVSKLGREKQKAFLLYGTKIFRLCLLSNYHATSLVNLDGEEKVFLNGFSRFVSHSNGLSIVEAFETASYHIERNANPKILFTDLSLTMAKLLNAVKS